MKYVLLFLSLSLLDLNFAHAESPPSECSADDDCEKHQLCDASGACRPQSELCISSKSCGAGFLCSHEASSCPAEGERCNTEDWGHCREISKATCQKDTDCTDRELCWVTPNRKCAEGDELCEQAGNTECTKWGRMCGGKLTCSAQESCIAGRCVWEGQEDHAMGIEIDKEKEIKLREEWKVADNTTSPSESPGCMIGKKSSLRSVLLLLFFGAFFYRRRKYQSS